MNLPGLYLDEDTQSQALITALRARALTVLTTTEAGLTAQTDEAQLRFATSRDLVVVTSNVADFAAIHAQWLGNDLEHAGIIIIPQQKWGPGELALRMVRLLASVPGGNMHQRLEYISHW